MTSRAAEEAEGITSINVAPLVDIMLVLLIIFMVTAQLSISKSVPLDVPKTEHRGEAMQTSFSIVLRADGSAQIDGRPIPTDDVVLAQAKTARDQTHELRAIIKADSAVPHARVIHVLDLLKQAGVTKIAFAR